MVRLVEKLVVGRAAGEGAALCLGARMSFQIPDPQAFATRCSTDWEEINGRCIT